MDRIMLTVKEVSEALGTGINQAYSLVKTEDFPSIKIGQQYFVPKDMFYEWIKKKAKKE